MLQNAASDQGLLCLPLSQQIIQDTSAGNEIDLQISEPRRLGIKVLEYEG